MDIPYQDTIHEVDSVIESLYEEVFGELFEKVSELYKRFKSHTQPISDGELEQILTELPLNLFTVAEKLSSMKLRQSVTKLENKRTRRNLLREYNQSDRWDDLSAGARRDAISFQIEDDTFDNDIVVMVYDAVIERVESEISFTRELIMGAKKLWDARKANVLPTGEIGDKETPPLPEYIDWTHKDSVTAPSTSKTYIHGGNDL